MHLLTWHSDWPVNIGRQSCFGHVGHKNLTVAVFETVSQCDDNYFGASVKDTAMFSHLSFGTAPNRHTVYTALK